MPDIKNDLGAGAVMLFAVSAFGMWMPNGFLAVVGGVGALICGCLWVTLTVADSQG